MNRRTAIVVLVLAAAAIVPAAALATPADSQGSHTVEICHVTNSETNEFVLATVDVAAFDGEGANDHTHHENKFGNSDFLAFGPEGAKTCEDTYGG